MSYECKKCGESFEELNDFKGHNLRCKPEEKEEPKSEKRRKRIPIGVPRRKMSWDNQDPNYEYRWVKGSHNRLKEFEDGGYEYVHGSASDAGDSDVINETGGNLGSKVSKFVGTNEDGTPRKDFLMRVKKEWYIEDQVEKRKYIDELESQIMKGVDSQGSPGVGGRYIPKSGGTQIE